ncbi:MAG: hypothetical protein Crog4KO_36100 [Crocinitomicaceae bacterium]
MRLGKPEGDREDFMMVQNGEQTLEKNATCGLKVKLVYRTNINQGSNESFPHYKVDKLFQVYCIKNYNRKTIGLHKYP